MIPSLKIQKSLLSVEKSRTLILNRGFEPLTHIINTLEVAKKRDALSSVSLSVPLTLPTSNSFYENVDELYSLKETLIQQGILSGEGNGLALARD